MTHTPGVHCGAALPDSGGAGPPSVLLVDDDPFVRDVLRRMLELAGARVTTSPGAADALRRIDDATFEVLVTDMQMPGMDGLALAAVARQRRPLMKVVLLTGWDDAACPPGVDVVLTKPVGPADIRRLLRDLLPPPSGKSPVV